MQILIACISACQAYVPGAIVIVINKFLFLYISYLDILCPQVLGVPRHESFQCLSWWKSLTWMSSDKFAFPSKENLLAELASIEATEEDSYFSFLPLAHIYDQIMENYCIYKGSSIGFWRGDIRFLMDEIQELKPSIFCGVPRMLFQYAYNYKLSNMEKGLPQDKAAPLMDKLVFDKIKLALGGRVRLMLSGAAPLPRHVEEFLRVTSCSFVSQGYGLTESCGGCFTSIANVFPIMGTVGAPIMTIEARLESVPELGYDALSRMPRGKICLRGRTLFSGYHKREDLTQDVLVDGWFHTGKFCHLRCYCFMWLSKCINIKYLRGFEMLKAIHLEPNPFDMKRDLITPTFKLKRSQLLKYYKDLFDKLYNEVKEARA
ncbi:hypothetical protein UlMin_032313 [Ulmus minor]